MTLENLISEKTKVILEKKIKMSRVILITGHNICELNSSSNRVNFLKLNDRRIAKLNCDIQYNKYYENTPNLSQTLLFVKTNRDIDPKYYDFM